MKNVSYRLYGEDLFCSLEIKNYAYDNFWQAILKHCKICIIRQTMCDRKYETH